MDDPTMRGYEQWWKQEQKLEKKKEPMIVDLDEGIMKPHEALVEFRGVDISFDSEDQRINTVNCRCVPIPVDEPELSDPTDCPRCRGVKRKVPFVCDNCRKEMGVDDGNEEQIFKYVREAKLSDDLSYTAYPMSFMAEKKEKDPDFICKRCGRTKDNDQIVCSDCYNECGSTNENVEKYSRENSDEKQTYLERQNGR